MDRHEKLLKEIEVKFEHRFDLPRQKEEVQKVLSGLGMETLDVTLAVLNSTREISTKALIPHAPRGAMSFIGFVHSNTLTGELSETAVRTSAVVYRHAHMLRKATPTHPPDIFVEGPPYSFKYQQDPTWTVPGTTIPVFSEEGQELLCQNHGSIIEISREKRCQYDGILWHAMFPHMRGLEKEKSHTESVKTLQAHSTHVFGFSLADRQVVQGLLDGKVGFSRTTPRYLVFNGQRYASLPAFIQHCEQYVEGIRAFARMNERRDEEAMKRAESVLPQRIAHIIYGANHIRGIMEECIRRKIALLLCEPTGMEVHARGTFQFDDSERNDNYTIITQIIPQLKRIPSA